MRESFVLGMGILGLALVLSVTVYVFGRLRIAQQTTLQKLLEREAADPELMRAAGFTDRRGRDLRRGLLLVGLAVAWSAVTFFLGGRAWVFGAFPLALGGAHLLLWILDGRPR